MNKFTSNLDFSLTKKRFRMMFKEASALKNSLKSFILVPVIFLTAFIFCAESSENNFHIVTDDNEDLYADLELGYKSPSGRQDNELLYYTTDGNLFTGTLSWFQKKTDRLISKQFYENGLIIEAAEFDENGEQVFRIEHVFEDGLRSGFRQYGEGDQILRDWVGTPALDDSLSTFREWHTNGQLKFEMTSYSGEDRPMVYEGLMTLYDEQGNILEQELYEDGKLLEKIK